MLFLSGALRKPITFVKKCLNMKSERPLPICTPPIFFLADEIAKIELICIYKLIFVKISLLRSQKPLLKFFVKESGLKKHGVE